MNKEYKWLDHKFIYSSVNLTKFLEPLEQQKCLILADNYAKVDIIPYHYPILLRRYSLGALVPKRKKPVLIWMESETKKLNGSIFSSIKSKYKAGILDW